MTSILHPGQELSKPSSVWGGNQSVFLTSLAKQWSKSLIEGRIIDFIPQLYDIFLSRISIIIPRD